MSIEQILKSKGYRVTAGRVRLLEILRAAGEPLSIRDILKRTKGGLLDQVTLYRALESFSKSGVVVRADLNAGIARYEYGGTEHHHHLVCSGCGKVEDIADCSAEAMQKKVLERSGFKNIYSHNLEFFGSCKTCA